MATMSIATGAHQGDDDEEHGDGKHRHYDNAGEHFVDVIDMKEHGDGKHRHYDNVYKLAFPVIVVAMLAVAMWWPIAMLARASRGE